MAKNNNPVEEVVNLLSDTAVEALTEGADFPEAFEAALPELKDAFRALIAAEMAGEVTTTRRAKSSSGGKRGPKPGSKKRTTEELEALTKQFVTVVRKNPEGIAMGEIAQALDVEPVELNIVSRDAREQKLVRMKGSKRSAVYVPVGEKKPRSPKKDKAEKAA